MFKNHTIGVVIPCYNEERCIKKVINTLPSFVDNIIIINDASTDGTGKILNDESSKNSKIDVINNDKNNGVGDAIAKGYMLAKKYKISIIVVMAGDGQMNPNNLEKLILPIINKECDYSKGNRLYTRNAYKKIPKVRLYGNAVLTLLTKVASGYWDITDSQNGYTAINLKALNLIDWDRMYKKYGQPNDLLVSLNVLNLKVKDIPMEPVYNVGEISNIKIYKVIFTISFLLLKKFLWRLKIKYVINDFHPLVFFYIIGFLFLFLTIFLFLRLIVVTYETNLIPQLNAFAMMFCFSNFSLFTLFAMFFDKLENDKL